MTLSNKDLLKLQAFDTPTICNALDIASPERRLKGFTSKPLVSVGIQGSFCGYVKTAKITAKMKPKENSREKSNAYYNMLQKNRNLLLL